MSHQFYRSNACTTRLTVRGNSKDQGVPKGQGAPKGQGMVEFALILPMLLLLLFGIIEVGRLLVTYSSVQAASREAGRYASAAGDADPNTPGLQPYYLDTTGIAAAARRVALFAPINSVTVAYDHGPTNANVNGDFNPSGDPGAVSLADRVKITITAPFQPFLGMTPIRPFTITSTTVRTIVKDVKVVEDVASGGPSSGNPTVTITKPVEQQQFFEGDSIAFQGSAKASNGSDLTSLLVWSASNDVSWAGYGGNFSSALKAGDPAQSYLVYITAQVTDSNGKVGTKTVSIYVYKKIPPEVTITLVPSTNPSQPTSFQQGEPVTINGIARDYKKADISSLIKWYLNGTQVASGAAYTSSSLAVGTYTMIGQVTDPATGLTTNSLSVTFAVVPNLPPELTILTPTNGSQYSNTTVTVNLTGSAKDTMEGDISSKIQWYKGTTLLGTGAAVNLPMTTLAGNPVVLGSYTITAEVTDLQGNKVTKSVTITVVNTSTPPSIKITAPANGTTYKQGTSVIFTGVATEVGGKDISTNIEWYSTIDGYLGSGSSISVVLSAGVHTITARVADSSGITNTASIGVIISPDNVPVVTILTPANQEVFDLGAPIVFSATALDTEDGNLSAKIQWLSNLQSPNLIGAGATFTTTNLVVGTHTIRAEVKDSAGHTGFSTITIVVRQPVVCPTGGTLAFVCSGTTCDKLAWKFSTLSPSILNLDQIVVSWENTDNKPTLASLSWGGGTPDPILPSGNVNSSPITLSGNPLWYASFNPDSGNQYSRTLVVNFASPAPQVGQVGDYTIMVRFADCPTSQATTTLPTP
jgi:Flp pilus assembly protein TadG